MATSESQRVAAHRKESFDRISLLLEKGGRQLVKVLALREDCTSAELCRRAILARAGLRIWPFPDQTEKLSDIVTKKEANTAIRYLQAAEADEARQQIIDELASEPSTGQFKAVLTVSELEELSTVISHIQNEIEKKRFIRNDTRTIELTGSETGILRRFIANLVVSK